MKTINATLPGAVATVALLASSLVAFAEPARRVPQQPGWEKTVTADHVQLGQPFVIDGINVRIDRAAYVDSFADGTPADTGARVVEIEFWAHNPEPNNIHFFDRFYAYAVMSDGTDTDGEGLSFFLTDSNKELGEFSLKPGENIHMRFDVEVPAKSAIAQLVIRGPVDGAKVTITPLAAPVLRKTL